MVQHIQHNHCVCPQTSQPWALHLPRPICRSPFPRVFHLSIVTHFVWCTLWCPRARGFLRLDFICFPYVIHVCSSCGNYALVYVDACLLVSRSANTCTSAPSHYLMFTSHSRAIKRATIIIPTYYMNYSFACQQCQHQAEHIVRLVRALKRMIHIALLGCE